MFVMTYLVANRWGSTIEKTRTIKAMDLWEARTVADRFMASFKSKGQPVYPLYDLVEEAA